MKYDFNEQEVGALLIFLNRTNIQGQEADVMSDLKKKLAQPLPEAPVIPPVEPIQVED